MLDISITLIIIAHVVVSFLMILVILMQRPKQEGLGAAFGSGMTDQAFGARTSDVLQKGTVFLGTLFFVFSLVLAILMGKRNAIESAVIEEGKAAAKTEEVASTENLDIQATALTEAEKLAQELARELERNEDSDAAETTEETALETTETTVVEPTEETTEEPAEEEPESPTGEQ